MRHVTYIYFIFRCDIPQDLTHVSVIYVHVTCYIYIYSSMYVTRHMISLRAVWVCVCQCMSHITQGCVSVCVSVCESYHSGVCECECVSV